MYDLSVIIPTFNEEENILNIIEEVDAVLKKSNLNGEILVVDDNSQDRTITLVREMHSKKENVNIIVRLADHGLSQSVAEGFTHASSQIFIVIDADLSHPPALIPKMYEEIRAGNDLVIGSRYMEGGGIRQWPLKRRLISIGATFLGRLLFPDITDPVSGFFAVKKEVVVNAPLRPKGYKILLEVLGKGTWENDREIPFEFVDREIGSSKLKFRTITEYARQVVDITFYSFFHHQSAAWREWKKVFKFGIVGLSGIIVNLGLLQLLLMAGISGYISLFFAIAIAILNNFIWNDLWTFRSSSQRRTTSIWQRLWLFYTVSAGGAIINYGIAMGLTNLVGMNLLVSDTLGILVGFIWNFLINRRFTWGRR
ncbi:glycosyltransferase family 2 protein [uncultured Methanoregula sp.]|uniref:glycosyltransferase family 2 protein n=1 Tax=uncultured Methanoregula sp. TaxID=1005933 RepID=UPI002AAAAFA4|nr:glycosyltransferase family 2 protein [uncultured Methanoregula sp.]